MLVRLTQTVFHLGLLLARPLTLGVRGIILNENREVLLVRHAYSGGWHLPGGGVENGESCETALLRELAEEVGIEALKTKLDSVIHNKSVSKRDHVLFYNVLKWKTLSHHTPPPREIRDARWFSSDTLPKDLAKDSRDALTKAKSWE